MMHVEQLRRGNENLLFPRQPPNYAPSSLFTLPRAEATTDNAGGSVRHNKCDLVSLLLLMLVLALVCSSLAQVGWFRQTSTPLCSVHFAPYQFFDFGYFERELTPWGQEVLRYHCAFGVMDCVTPKFVLVMKCLIGTAMSAILIGVASFALELYIPSASPSSFPLSKLRRSKVLTSIVVFLLFLVLVLAHFSTTLLQLEAERIDPRHPIAVQYEYGFWTMITAAAAAAGVIVLSTGFTQMILCGQCRVGSRRMRRWESSREVLLEDQDLSPPPPPYSAAVVTRRESQQAPPPPYEP
jgi:hypothetical protein